MTTPSQHPAPESQRARSAYLWVGVVVPLTILAIAAMVIASWLPEVPDPSAIHWGADGVDGFGAPWMNLVVPIGISAGCVLLFAGLSLAASRVQPSGEGPASLGSRRQAPSVTARFLGATSLGLATMMSFVALVTVHVQRGLDDARDAPDIGGAVAIGFGLLIGFTVLGWFLQPASPTPVPADVEPAGRIPLVPGGRAAWFGTATMTRAGVVTLGVSLAILVALSVLLLAQGQAEGGWIVAILTGLMLVLIAAMLTFRVRVDAAGLTVRSALGWPRTRIPLAQVAKVESVQVNPFAEFGGWGWRLGLDGRRGVVLRTGEALQVTDARGRVFVVTVDGASDAASVLHTLRTAPSVD